jgi:hypothetical protein
VTDRDHSASSSGATPPLGPLGAPVEDTDAATKEYVDAATGGGSQPAGSQLAHGSGPPSNPINEEQDLTGQTSFPWAGTFRLTFEGDETGDIDVNATTLDEVVVMLEGLPGIDAGNIQLTGVDGSGSMVDNGGEMTVQFVGDLAGQPLSLLTVTSLAVTRLGDPVDPADWVVTRNIAGEAGSPSGDELLYVDDDDPARSLYVKVSGTWVLVISSVLGSIPQGGPLTTSLDLGPYALSGSDAQLTLGATARLIGNTGEAGQDGVPVALVAGGADGGAKQGAGIEAGRATVAAHGKLGIQTGGSTGTRGQVLARDGSGSVWKGLDGCRYTISAADGSPVLVNASDVVSAHIEIAQPFYDTGSPPYFDGTLLHAPADGYYEIAANVKVDFSASDGTWIQFALLRGAAQVEDGRLTLAKIVGADSSGRVASKPWLAAGEPIRLYVTGDWTSGARPGVSGAFEVQFLGA